MKKNIAILLLLLSTNSIACSNFKVAQGDSWTGKDKAKHFSISVPFGAIGAYVARDSKHPVLYGALIGTLPGLAKEIYDGCRAGGTGFSGHDMAYNFLGSLVGASLGNYSINYYKTPSGKEGLAIGYKSSF